MSSGLSSSLLSSFGSLCSVSVLSAEISYPLSSPTSSSFQISVQVSAFSSSPHSKFSQQQQQQQKFVEKEEEEAEEEPLIPTTTSCSISSSPLSFFPQNRRKKGLTSSRPPFLRPSSSSSPLFTFSTPFQTPTLDPTSTSPNIKQLYNWGKEGKKNFHIEKSKKKKEEKEGRAPYLSFQVHLKKEEEETKTTTTTKGVSFKELLLNNNKNKNEKEGGGTSKENSRGAVVTFKSFSFQIVEEGGKNFVEVELQTRIVLQSDHRLCSLQSHCLKLGGSWLFLKWEIQASLPVSLKAKNKWQQFRRLKFHIYLPNFFSTTTKRVKSSSSSSSFSLSLFHPFHLPSTTIPPLPPPTTHFENSTNGRRTTKGLEGLFWERVFRERVISNALQEQGYTFGSLHKSLILNNNTSSASSFMISHSSTWAESGLQLKKFLLLEVFQMPNWLSEMALVQMQRNYLVDTYTRQRRRRRESRKTKCSVLDFYVDALDDSTPCLWFVKPVGISGVGTNNNKGLLSSLEVCSKRGQQGQKKSYLRSLNCRTGLVKLQTLASILSG